MILPPTPHDLLSTMDTRYQDYLAAIETDTEDQAYGEYISAWRQCWIDWTVNPDHRPIYKHHAAPRSTQEGRD